MKQDFRHLFRHFVPRAIYQHLSQCADFVAITRREGLAAWGRLHPMDGAEITLDLQSLAHPFTLRRTAPQINGLMQNVMRGEYDRWLEGLNPSVIVDAGSYIGDLTCHWATRYPEARIIALEPNPDSFARASLNLRPYGDRVTLIQSGLGDHEGHCSISGSEMGAHLVKGNSGEVQSVRVTTVDVLLDELGLNSVDLLKLDIEGAEKEVLATAPRWISRVKCLVVEFHGADLEAAGVAELARHGFGSRRHRSLVTFSRGF
jgi:FkbM family methyltransferase